MPGPQTVATTGTSGPDKEIFGFATAGSLADPTFGYPSWNFNLLSTVAFFSISVKYNGVIGGSGWYVFNSSVMTGLVNTAHAHGVKVVVTLTGPGAPDLCDALYNGLTTVQQIVAQVVAKNLDGVNIDYEGQLQTCHPTNPALVPQTNQALLTTFAHELRTGLDNVRPGYYLSIDTYSGSAAGTGGFFNIPDLNQYVDSFFVMAYDMDYANLPYPPLNCSSFCLSPVSPLTNYNYNDTISMSQYSSVVGGAKTILGQPYYGRVACVAKIVPHATPTGYLSAATYLDAAAAISSPDIKPGTYAIHRDANDPTGLDRWDTWYDNSLHCWREMYWGDVTQLATRYRFVNQFNLRGVGFWTLNYGGGAAELWNALQTYFVNCTNVGLSASPLPPQLSGTPVQLTATSGACLNPLYEFWLQPPGGSWTMVQHYTSSYLYSWSTIGKPYGTYHFSVWVRDANSRGTFGSGANAYDAFSTFDYQLTTSPCASITASASPPSGVAGTPVTISATAVGCPNPSFEFWIQPPGGGWSVAQPYSTNAVLKWTTTSKPAGTYHFSVWARDLSSLGTGGSRPNTYDAFGGISYVLGVPSCPAVTSSATPPSTGAVGTSVAVTGSATGCPNPLYEFWLLPPAGNWTLVQRYSASATFTWNTLGARSGSYTFSVWARDEGSPRSYDSYSSLSYSLTPATPCTAVSASAAPPTSTTVGLTVTVTAAATGCSNPRYEYWVLPPGGSWTLLQLYTNSATLTWHTTGQSAGSYQFSVWARDAASPGTGGTPPNTYDSFGVLPYALT